MGDNTLRSRCSLHQSKLEAFTKWLVSKGWKLVKGKSVYEVLRMTRKGKYGNKTLLVYKKDDAKEHLTTFGTSELARQAWMKEKKG